MLLPFHYNLRSLFVRRSTTLLTIFSTLLPASIRYGELEHSGRICIRSVREVKSQLRYGVSYAAELGGRSGLADGLRAIVQALPRENQDGTSSTRGSEG